MALMDITQPWVLSVAHTEWSLGLTRLNILTALCALKELNFLLRALLRETLNKKFVPHTIEKCYMLGVVKDGVAIPLSIRLEYTLLGLVEFLQ